jgi:FlaG/FlaF family flagellin (archaellin)
MVTMQILNSVQGQQALKHLDQQKLALYDNTTERVTATIDGTWYGKSSVAGTA